MKSQTPHVCAACEAGVFVCGLGPNCGGLPRGVPRQHRHHGVRDREIMPEFVRLVRTASPERY